LPSESFDTDNANVYPFGDKRSDDEHPLTAVHLREVVRHVEGPIGQNLACDDVGKLPSSFSFVTLTGLD